jgi:hypothetical protein
VPLPTISFKHLNWLDHMNQSWRQSTSYLSESVLRVLKEVGTKAVYNVVDQHNKSMSCHPLVLESKHMQRPSNCGTLTLYTHKFLTCNHMKSMNIIIRKTANYFERKGH